MLGRPFISSFLRVWLYWLEFESGLWGLRGGNVKEREVGPGGKFCIRMSIY